MRSDDRSYFRDFVLSLRGLAILFAVTAVVIGALYWAGRSIPDACLPGQ